MQCFSRDCPYRATDARPSIYDACRELAGAHPQRPQRVISGRESVRGEYAPALGTLSGIRLDDLPGFIAAKVCGAVVGFVAMSWLMHPLQEGPDRQPEAQL
jgi:hypothetical protein